MTITGRPETRDGQDHLVLTRTFAAPVEDVWAAITESERLGRWFGTWTGDPATGQVRVQWDFEDEVADEVYAIDACEAPHRPRADRPVRRAAYRSSTHHDGRRERMTITGRPETRDGQDHLVLTRTFTASVEDVWAAITESERLGRWFGTWTGDPSTGRVRVQWDFEDEVADEVYAIDACEAPHHLRLHNVDDDPSQVWTLDLRLREDAGRTVLDFAQVMNEGLPVTDVGPGWEYYLDRLADSMTTGRVSTVGWDGYLELGREYAEAFGVEAGGGSATG